MVFLFYIVFTLILSNTLHVQFNVYFQINQIKEKILPWKEKPALQISPISFHFLFLT